MKKLLVVLFAVAFSAAVGFAQDNDDDVVRWRSIVGVITTPGVNNPVAGINAGATAWTTRAAAPVSTSRPDLLPLRSKGWSSTERTPPERRDLFSEVVGTLVCGAGSTTQIVLDTTPISSERARRCAFLWPPFRGTDNLRQSPLPGAHRGASRCGRRWIGTGVERFIGDDGK